MLDILTIGDSDKWNEIIKSFKNYDVYYLSSYTKAFQIHGDGEPLLFYYRDEEIKAINVVMKRDIGKSPVFLGKIPESEYFDLTTPYGYGGFIIEGNINENSLKRLDELYSFYCYENNIISEIVRFHPVLKNHIGLEDIYEIVNLGKTVSINLKTSEYIWNNLTSKNRNVIRKSEKNEVKIFWGRDPKLINEFVEMYNSTMDKDSADDYYYFNEDFYKSVLNDLKYNFLIFYAVYKEEIIAMSMIMFSNKQIHYHLSASKREYLTYAPTNLLLYEVACWGVNNGYDTLHLGGGLGSKEDSLYKFKKAFNKNEDNEFYLGKKIFDKEKYDELLEIRMKEKEFDLSTGYFPKYRG